MDAMKLMESRHSVRQYTPKPVEPEKRDRLNALAAELNEKAGLHIQILYDEPECFSSFMAHYGKFSGVNNYIALVGPGSSKLEETVGYCGEQLVLLAQELGLNTCWVALTHGRSKAVVHKGEKQVCLISLGYGTSQGVPHKSRTLQEVCRCSEEMPEWFRLGAQAALLAPTAMNQQKFTLTLLPADKAEAKAGSGFYSKVDLGIVKYHFELASGRKL